MKILLACEDFRIGGAQIFTLNIGKELEKTNNIYLYSHYQEYIDWDLVNYHFPDAKIIYPKIHFNKTIKKIDRLLYKLKIDFSIREKFVEKNIKMIMRKHNFDIIHSNMFKSDYIFSKALKNFKVPIIITMHGNYETFMENIENFNGELIWNYFKKVQLIVKRINGISILSNKNLDIFKKSEIKVLFKKAKIPTRKIYNGFAIKRPSNEFQLRSSLCIKSDDLVYGMVGRGIPEKGWEIAIKAFLEMNLDKQAHLVLIGWSKYLNELKTKYNKNNNIHFLGYKRNTIEWINTFDIGLLPTTYGESLPTVIIEYLSCGIPVISTDIGEIKSMITWKDKIAGEIISINRGEVSKNELINSMKQLPKKLKKDYEMKKIIKNAYNNFSIKNCTQSYNDFYSEILINNKNNFIIEREYKKKRILLILPQFGEGGAERSISKLSNILSNNNDVFLLVNNLSVKSIYNNSGKIISLNIPISKNVFHKILLWSYKIYKVKKIKKEEKIQISISFLEGSNYLNVLSRYKEKVFVTIRGSLYNDQTISGIKGLLRKKVLIPSLFNRSDLIVTVTNQLKQEMEKYFRSNKNRIISIPNFYNINKIMDQSNKTIKNPLNKIFDKPVIIAAGRLHPQKNYSNLIKVFSKVKSHNNIRLLILGDGYLKNKLIKDSENLGLKTCNFIQNGYDRNSDIFFLGYHRNPFAFMARSELFLLTSNWEGFPNVLAEAMISGVPVISADCPTGPREILSPNSINNGINQTLKPEYAKYGILLPMLSNDLLELKIKIWSETIIKMLSDKKLRNEYSKMGKNRMIEFDQNKIYKRWENLIGNV
ncbi:MAG: hypothetical protein CMG75_07795 [Candidatus Marinimicrobia bacterium]|nr:hypothetical protein [Candidatus Neomarinimicrobiota bacterium]|tara:strand:- start:1656 stop:4115 length:2460 start_codon:yes stop_codon:yes gene_type:complete